MLPETNKDLQKLYRRLCAVRSERGFMILQVLVIIWLISAITLSAATLILMEQSSYTHARDRQAQLDKSDAALGWLAANVEPAQLPLKATSSDSVTWVYNGNCVRVYVDTTAKKLLEKQKTFSGGGDCSAELSDPSLVPVTLATGVDENVLPAAHPAVLTFYTGVDNTSPTLPANAATTAKSFDITLPLDGVIDPASTSAATYHIIFGGVVASSKLADNAVTSAKLGTGSVTGAKLATNGVPPAAFDANAISTRDFIPLVTGDNQNYAPQGSTGTNTWRANTTSLAGGGLAASNSSYTLIQVNYADRCVPGKQLWARGVYTIYNPSTPNNPINIGVRMREYDGPNPPANLSAVTGASVYQVAPSTVPDSVTGFYAQRASGWRMIDGGGCNANNELVNPAQNPRFYQVETNSSATDPFSVVNAGIEIRYAPAASALSAQPPYVPEHVAPADGSFVLTATPTLKARFNDPNQADTGQLNFQVCSDPACSTVITSGSSAAGIANGSSGTWAVPGGSLLDGGTYYWRVQGQDNTGLTSSFAADSPTQFKVSTTPPTLSLALVAGTNPSYQSITGTTVYFNPAQTGSFTAQATVTDSKWPLDTLTFPALGANWTGGGTVNGPGNSPPTVNQTYNWAAGAGTKSPATVSLSSTTGRTATSNFDAVADSTAPTGGTISYVNGTVMSGPVALNGNFASDTGSGVATGTIERRSDNAASCGSSWSSWATVSTIGTGAGAWATNDNTVASGTCYQYRYVAADKVANSNTFTTAATVTIGNPPANTVAPVITDVNGAPLVDGDTVTTSNGTWTQSPTGYSYAWDSCGYKSVVQQDNPAGYWRLGETAGWNVAIDESGNGNGGWYTGSPTLGAAGALSGDSNTAATFNGTSQYLTVGSASSLNFGTGNFTIEAWIKTGASPLTAIIAEKYGAGVGYQLYLANGHLKFWLNGSGYGGAGALLSNNSWHYVAVTANRAGNATLYVDGAVDQTYDISSAAGQTASNTAPFDVGYQQSPSPQFFFSGSVDDVSVYPSALSAARITAHYQAGNAGTALCSAISGQTTSSLTVAAAQVGNKVRSQVTATNSSGSTTAPSSQSSVVQAVAPANTSVPTIADVQGNVPPVVGDTLNASPGVWTGSSPSYSYQWQRCDASAAAVVGDSPAGFWRLNEPNGTSPYAADSSGSARAGAYVGSPTYGAAGPIASSPNGAIQLNGSTQAVSMPAVPLSGDFSLEAWVNLAGDSLKGATGYGTILGEDTTFSPYHRLLVSTSGQLLAQIDGSGNFFSTSNISLNSWHLVDFVYTGANAYWYIDGAAAGSEATSGLTWNQPFRVGAYNMNDYMFNGKIADVAAYDSALTSTSVAAHFSAAATYCSPIAGTVGSSYTVQATDAGAKLKVSVTGANPAGNASASSAETGRIASAAPTVDSSPTISGTLQVGQPLTSSAGSFSGAPTLTRSYSWQRCGYGAVVRADNPTAWWRLGDTSGTTAIDQFAFANGSYVGGPSLAWGGATALDGDSSPLFNGTSQYVDVTTPIQFDSGDFTVEGWIQTNSAAVQQLWNSGYNGGNPDVELMLQAGGHPYFYVRDAGGAIDSFTAASLNIADSQWHQLVGVRSGSTVYLYVDGALAGSSSGALGDVDTAGVGARIGNGLGAINNRWVNGRVDEVSIYKNALPASSVLTHYNMARQGCQPVGGGNLTLSGNETGDAASSEKGVYSSATNLVANGDFETGITGWSAYDWYPGAAEPAPTIARDTTTAKIGTASLRVDVSTPNTGWKGVNISSGITLTNGVSYTSSAWVKAAAGHTIQMYLDTAANPTASVVSNGSWQRLQLTGTGDGGSHYFYIRNNGDTNFSFWIDGAQLEQSPFASPIIPTNGTTATRGGAQIQAPASLINVSTGWWAIRLRMGWAATASPTLNPAAFGWGAAAGHLELYYEPVSRTWQMFRGPYASGYASSAAQSFTAGSTITLVGTWNGTTAGISVNGSPFNTATTGAAGAAPTSPLEIGSALVAGEGQIDSSILWAAAGTGTLTNADAATFNGFGNADPGIAALPGSPTLFWDGSGSAYQGSAAAGANTYTPTSSDWDARLRSLVTASNSSGSASSGSQPTAKIVPAPANLSAPTTSGILRDGQLVQKTFDGSWTNSPSINYRWQRCQDYATTVLADGPVGYWRLNESSGTSATDAAGGANGTYSNAVLGQTGALSACDSSNTAASFNGSNASVSLPASSVLDDTGAVTVEGWIYPTSTTGFKAILSSRGGSTGQQYSLYMENGQLQMNYFNGSTWWFTDGGTVTANQWNYVAATRSADGNTITYYVNNNAPVVVSGAGVAGGGLTGYTHSIGYDPGYGTPASTYFPGKIDELAVYTKTLSGAQIANHYAAGTSVYSTIGSNANNYTLTSADIGSRIRLAVDASTSGGITTAYSTSFPGETYRAAVLDSEPTRYWRLGESSGTAAADAAGNENLTYTNGPTLGAASPLSGSSDTAATFNGTNQYATAATAAPRSYATALEGWVKMSAIPNPSNATIVGSLGNRGQEQLGVRITDGAPFFTFRDGVTWYTVTAPKTVVDSQWHYVAGTWDGTTESLYVDGALAASQSAPGAVVGALDCPWQVGGINCAAASYSGQYLNGSLDDVAVYDHALTAADVLTHWSASRGGIALADIPTANSNPSVSGKPQVGQTLTSSTPVFSGSPSVTTNYQWQRCNTYASAVSSDSPGGYWRLGEPNGTTLVNQVAGGSNATTSGSVSLGAAGATGDGDTAANFSGGTASAANYGTAGSGINPTSAITMEFWYKGAAPASGNMLFVKPFTSYAEPYYQYGVNGAGGNIRAVLYTRATVALNTWDTGVAWPTDGLWHYYAITYDAANANTSTLYIDGTQRTSSTTAWQGNAGVFATNLAFMNIPTYGGASTVQGQLDDLAIYTTALSPSRVWAHYNASAVTTCADIPGATSQSYIVTNADVGNTLRIRAFGTNRGGQTVRTSSSSTTVLTTDSNQVNMMNPVLFWRMNETAGTSIADSSGRGNTGTISGTYALNQPGAFGAAGDNDASIGFTNGVVTGTAPQINTGAGNYETANFWMYWDGGFASSGEFPLSLGNYNIWIDGGNNIGINTGNGDNFRTSAVGLANGWHMITVEIDSGSVAGSSMWIDGVQQTLTQYGTPVNPATTTTVNYGDSAGGGVTYTFSGRLDDLAIYNYALTSGQVQNLWNGYVAPGVSNTALPTISGTAQVGQTLTATPGAWQGAHPMSYSYQWRSCDTGGANCSDIGGATASTYQLQLADSGKTVRVVVTATVNGSSASATSAQTTTVLNPPPANTVLPVVSDNQGHSPPVVTDTMSGTAGTWTGNPTSYSYQWQQCDSAGSNCVNISGQTALSYTAASGDAGYTLRIAVTATNNGGSVTAYSTATSVVSTFLASGGSITSAGTDKVHTFTSSGTFTITAGSGTAQVLVVAGGGGGGGGNAGGGGGGGAVIYSGAYSLGVGSYSVTVGGGGAAGNTGGGSSFSGISAAGGGAGNGGSGGNGGGGSYNGSGGSGTQGYGGGNGFNGTICGSGRLGGGGGGAGGTGTTGNAGASPTGGNGAAYSISGSSVYYGGGGGGGSQCQFHSPGGGGAGGGGGGSGYSGGTPAPGSANTGGGGGGGGTDSGGSTLGGAAGGSGIVIIRYR